jgi:hypothetical protein
MTGLAFDGYNFLGVKSDETLYRISLNGTITEIGTGYTKLYDTTDGYFITVGGISSVSGASGSSTPASGSYGTLKVVIS